MRRRAWAVGVLGAVALIVAAGGAMAGGRTIPPGVTVGRPWSGAPGIQRTVSAIMAEERGRGAATGRIVPPEHDADLHRIPNPDSPATTPDAKLGAAFAAGPVLSVGTSFTGATLAADSQFVPPDSMGAVGPSQFLVAVNGRIRVFSKAGVQGSLNATLDTFFSSVLTPVAGSHSTDPRVRYDPLSGKWFVTCIDFSPPNFVNNRVLIAVSDNGTITNATVWTFFQFEQDLAGPTGDSNDFADFDTLGIDANALYIGTNIFTSAGAFVNTDAFVIRKSSITGGGPIVVTAFRHLMDGSLNGPYTPQGVDNLDPSATEGYFVGVDGHFFGKLDVRRVGTPGGTPTISGNLAVTVPTDSTPLSVSVPGSSKALDAVDSRLTTASIQGGKLYTAESIATDNTGTAGGSADRDAVRWYELANLTTTPTLSRSGTIVDSATGNPLSFWMPSVAVSGQGHAVVGVTAGGAAARPNAAVASMLTGTSTFTAPASYTAAGADYNVDTGDPTYRWGDYSMTTVDPCDQQTFWSVQEYVDGTDSWGVKVGRIAAPPPATPSSGTPSSVAVGQPSANVTLTGTSSSGSGFWDPGSGSCRIAAMIDGNVTVNSVTYTDPTHLSLNISTVGATPGSRTLTITNPDGQTSSAAVLTVTGSGSAPANTAPPTITGTTTVGSTLTATTGTWTGSPAPTLAYQWKRCDSGGANCGPIAGATASTYMLAAADQGSRLLVTVTATNTSGSASADSPATATIGPAPGGSGGGGGGGGGGSADVVISFGAAPATPSIGDTLTYTLTAAIKSGSASDVRATIDLPTQVSLVSASSTRGPGCTGTTTLSCDLDFLSGNLVAQLTVMTQVTASGTLTATASLTSTPADTNTADNSASVTTIVAAPPPPPPPAPSASPVLKQLGSRTLSGVRHGANEWFTARFSTNERMRVRMTVTRHPSTRTLALLKGSSLAGTRAATTRLTVSGLAGGAGGYGLKAVLERGRLVRGALYVVHLTATDSAGKRAALNIRFRAT
jgi:hypothetical protein